MQEETPQLGGIPPSPIEKFALKVNAAFRRWTATPAGRIAVFGGGAILAVPVIWGGLLLLRPSPETLDGFIARWNEAVEANDDVAYDALMQKSLIDTNSAAWNRGFDLLRALHTDGVVVEPFEAEIDPNAVTIPARAQHEDGTDLARVSLDWEGSEFAFHMERDGWRRRWSVADIHSSAPIKDDPQPLIVVAEEPEPITPTMDNATIEPVVYTPSDTPPLDTELKLKQILDSWRTSWENSDVDGYMDWYADYANILRVTVVDGREITERLTKDELRSRMRRLADKYDKVEVGVRGVRVRGTYAEADMQFTQEYTAYRKDNGSSQIVYRDIGLKTLKFVNVDGGWRIYEESWSTYVDVPSFPLN